MTKSINQNLTRGYMLALSGAAVLSTTAIFIRYLTQVYHLPALVLAFWRDVFVFLTLLPALRLLSPQSLRVPRGQWPYLVFYGFVLALFNATWTFSVALNGAAIATVLVYSSVAFTALLARWLLKERLGWAKCLAIALSFGGCVLVSGVLNSDVWAANLVGIVSGVLSGLCYAGYSLLGRSSTQRELRPWTTLLYIFGFAALFLLLFNVTLGGVLPETATRLADFFWLGRSLDGWAILFVLAAGPTIAGFGLYFASLTRLPSSVANLIATSEPVFTTLIAYFLLGERLSALQVGGSLLIIAGVLFLRLWEGAKERGRRKLASQPVIATALPAD